jgi:hypothetical protein
MRLIKHSLLNPSAVNFQFKMQVRYIDIFKVKHFLYETDLVTNELYEVDNI